MTGPDWVYPDGGKHERPRIKANHLGAIMPGTRMESGVAIYGWWAVFYEDGRFADTFREACEYAVALR